jgi:hypothetical protein
VLVEDDSEAGQAVRARLAEYVAFLGSIGQEQVEDTILRTLATLRARMG